MLKAVSFAVVLNAFASGGSHSEPDRAPRADFAQMNLSATRDVVRPAYARRDFNQDADLPLKVDYKLPASGLAASVGMNDGGERALENQEINQAAAIGFSRPGDTVGASIDYRF